MSDSSSLVGSLLLDLATRVEVSAALYGFVPERRGGAQVPNPDGGWAWPMSKWINCCTFVTVALHVVARQVGLPFEMNLQAWRLGMLNTTDRRGPVQLAVWMGLAPTGSSRLSPGDRLVRSSPGSSWYVAQGWNDSDGDGDVDEDDRGGHSLFLRVLPNGRILTLEARGRARGGAYKGQDGVGSRSMTPPNARQWEIGAMSGSVTKSLTEEDLLKTWPEFYVARLAA